MSSIRETAERIVREIAMTNRGEARLVDAVEQALRNERERAARIADAHTHYFTGRDTKVDCDCGAWIAVAIRKDD